MRQPPLPVPREWYGKSDGNGPLHILSDDRSAVLCGVTRFTVHRRSGLDHVCKRCEVEERRPAPVSAEADAAAYAAVEAACDAMAAARARLFDSLRLLRQARSPHFDEALALAFGEGIPKNRIADELGVSKQAMRMWLRRSPSR